MEIIKEMNYLVIPSIVPVDNIYTSNFNELIPVFITKPNLNEKFLQKTRCEIKKSRKSIRRKNNCNGSHSFIRNKIKNQLRFVAKEFYYKKE